MIKLSRKGQKTIIRVANLKRLTKEAVEFAGYTSGQQLIKATSAEILRKPKGGRTYFRRDRIGRRRRHIASAPGETHANMSGTLRRSLSFRVNSFELEFGYGVQKGDAPEYAASVEFGTRKMAARPSLQNGIRDQRRNIQNNLEREIEGRLR